MGLTLAETVPQQVAHFQREKVAHINREFTAANRQLAFGDKSMTYDANGNLTSITDPSGVSTFTWDARTRLVGLSDSSGTASFTYDPLARRNTKTINGQLSQFIYDGLDMAQQLDSLGTTSYLRSLNIDEALSFTNRNGTSFLISDPLGSTLAATDATATPVVQYTYDPFGTTSSTDPTFPNPSQYTGGENDAVGSFYYYRARYYQPQLRRFISEDPIGLAGGDVNLYAYVFNNPIGFRDPFGLELVSGTTAVIVCGGGATAGLGGTWLMYGRKATWVQYAQGAAVGCTAGMLALYAAIAGGAAGVGAAVSGEIGIGAGAIATSSRLFTPQEVAVLRQTFGQSVQGARDILQQIEQGTFERPAGSTAELLRRYERIAIEAIRQGNDKLGVQARRLEIIRRLTSQ
jgi:RHS repeat-associated protein